MLLATSERMLPRALCSTWRVAHIARHTLQEWIMLVEQSIDYIRQSVLKKTLSVPDNFIWLYTWPKSARWEVLCVLHPGKLNLTVRLILKNKKKKMKRKKRKKKQTLKKRLQKKVLIWRRLSAWEKLSIWGLSLSLGHRPDPSRADQTRPDEMRRDGNCARLCLWAQFW